MVEPAVTAASPPIRYVPKTFVQDPGDAKKKRPAFPAERFCLAQRMRYSTSTNSGSPVQITRSVYTKPSTSTATQQPSTNTKYVFPINRKWYAPNRCTKQSYGCRPRLNTSL